MERLLLKLILNEDGYFDGTNRKKMPTGWVHLPALANSVEDHKLCLLATALKKPHARDMAESWTNSYGTKKRRFTGIVVPAEDVVEISQTMERVARGEVEIAHGQLRELTQRR